MERIYIIPLRREFQKVPNYKRASKARRAVREFLIKHMKAKEVKIGKYLNEEIWKNGPKNPPHKVNVKAIKEEDIVRAELVGAPVEAPEPEKKKKGSKKEKSKLEEKVEEIKAEPKKEEKTPTAKELKEKKETKKKTEKTTKVPKAAELKEKKTSKKK